MKTIKIKFWQYGIVVTLLLSTILGYNLFKGDKTYFLSGDTSHGHYQIELACNSCHTTSFADEDAMQAACESCHEKELEAFNDSHPKKKFLDPRNADLLSQLDARYCVTCHTEHKPEITRESGVTIAPDFCFHCHQGIYEERESHKDFAFDSCASAGCHNYHDNSMLYEDFIIKHIDQPDVKKKAQLPARTSLIRWLKKNKDVKPLTKDDHDALTDANPHPELIDSWSQSVHAQTAVNCSGCHDNSDTSSNHYNVSVAKIDSMCIDCHERQVEGFHEGKHGMRTNLGLTNMSPALARQPMKEHADTLLSCISCHDPHSLDVNQAAIESCLGCHNDEHSTAYKNSEHYLLWEKEQHNELPEGSGVTCASCHLPRIKKGKRVRVQHNQNANLRPNSKMLRTVCMNCHGLEFSLNALADDRLIQNNFQGQPNIELQTFDLIKERIRQRKER